MGTDSQILPKNRTCLTNVHIGRKTSYQLCTISFQEARPQETFLRLMRKGTALFGSSVPSPYLAVPNSIVSVQSSTSKSSISRAQAKRIAFFARKRPGHIRWPPMKSVSWGALSRRRGFLTHLHKEPKILPVPP